MTKATYARIPTSLASEDTDKNDEQIDELSKEQKDTNKESTNNSKTTSSNERLSSDKDKEGKNDSQEDENVAKKLPPTIDSKTMYSNYDIRVDDVKANVAPQLVLGSIPMLAKLFDVKSIDPLVRFADVPENFLRIFPGPNAFIDPTYMYSKFANSATHAFAGIMLPDYTSNMPRCGYLGMHCNNEEYPFTIDPFSPSLISNTSSMYDELHKMVLKLPIQGSAASTFSVTDQVSLQNIFSTIAYLLLGCMHSYGRTYLYVPNSLTQKNGFEPTYTPDDPASYMSTYSIPHKFSLTDPESFYVMKGANITFAQTFQNISDNYAGNIPRIDPTYQHNLNLLPLLHPLDAARDQLLLQVQHNTRPYGVRHSRTNSSRKIEEYAVMNRDIIGAQLHRNYNNWIADNSMNVDNLLALYESSCPIINVDFDPDYVDTALMKQYGFTLFADNVDQVVDRFSFFPNGAMYENCYLYGFKSNVSLSALYMSIFDKVRTHFSDSFQFMSRVDAMSNLTNASEISWNSAIVNIPAILDLGPEPSSDLLAQYMTYDLMSPFVNIQTSAITMTRRLDDKKPAYMMDYLSLVMEKYLFFNVYSRNKAVWMSKIDAFLLAYYPVEYSAFISTNGLCVVRNIDGTRTQCRSIPAITSSKYAPIISWSLETPNLATKFISRGANIESVVNTLLLTTDELGVYVTYTADYRVYKSRTVRLPGRICTPKAYASLQYPMAILLNRLLATCANFNVSYAMTYVKQMNNAFNTFRSALSDAISSYSAWFHEVYCPLYNKIARDPRLVISDRDDKNVFFVPFDSRLGYYDELPEWIQANNDNGGHPLTPADANYIIPIACPNVAGSAILLPTPDPSTFGVKSTRMVKNMMFIAVSPCSEHQGLNRVVSREYDFSVYTALYVNAKVTEDVTSFTNFLLKHHNIVEIEYFSSKMARDELNLPDTLAEYLRSIRTITMYTAASTAELMCAFGRARDVTYSGTSVMDTSYVDPRIYRSRLCTLNPLNLITKKHTVSQTASRPFVMENFDILIDKIFGQNGFRCVNSGYTVSKIPIHGPLRYDTVHTLPPVVFRFLRSTRKVVDNNNNVIESRQVTLTYGNDVRTIAVSSVETFGYTLINFCTEKHVNPGAVFQMTNATILTEDQIQFLTYGINYFQLVVVFYSGPEFPCFSIVTDHMLSVKFAPPVDSSLISTMASKRLFHIRSVSRYDSRIAFNTLRADIKAVDLLPLSPAKPTVVYEDLHDPGDAILQIDSFNPRIDTTVNEFNFTCNIDGDDVDMVVAAPLSLQTLVKIYKVCPLLYTHILQDLRTG